MHRKKFIPFQCLLFITGLLMLAATSPLTAQDPKDSSNSIGVSDLISAEKLFDLKFTAVKRDSILSGLEDHRQLYRYEHGQNLPNNIPLSLGFDPLLPGTPYDRH